MWEPGEEFTLYEWAHGAHGRRLCRCRRRCHCRCCCSRHRCCHCCCCCCCCGMEVLLLLLLLPSLPSLLLRHLCSLRGRRAHPVASYRLLAAAAAAAVQGSAPAVAHPPLGSFTCGTFFFFFFVFFFFSAFFFFFFFSSSSSSSCCLLLLLLLLLRWASTGGLSPADKPKSKSAAVVSEMVPPIASCCPIISLTASASRCRDDWSVSGRSLPLTSTLKRTSCSGAAAGSDTASVPSAAVAAAAAAVAPPLPSMGGRV